MSILGGIGPLTLASNTFRNGREIVYEAVKENSVALRYIRNKIRNDRKLMTTDLCLFSYIYDYICFMIKFF